MNELVSFIECFSFEIFIKEFSYAEIPDAEINDLILIFLLYI